MPRTIDLHARLRCGLQDPTQHIYPNNKPLKLLDLFMLVSLLATGNRYATPIDLFVSASRSAVLR